MAIKCWEKAAEKGLYLPIAWLINNYIDKSNREKVEYWMKKYNNCVQKDPQITKMLMRKYGTMM